MIIPIRCYTCGFPWLASRWELYLKKLDEYRKKGLAKQYTLAAIQAIRKEHQIKNVFVWAFTPEGNALAESIAKQENLPLLKRERK